MTNTNITQVDEIARIYAAACEKRAFAAAYAHMLEEVAGSEAVLTQLLTKATGGEPADLQEQDDGSLRDAYYTAYYSPYSA